ncbi:hypothetical protein DYBT9275_01573 [Dyadobacter sp. CECT 9275]|uniref:DUF6265 domain-containing protein n=1 Tax=Dyadobacter helix TaxID=2822344 RepID=A0A916NBL6_9BACT|nr:DUF6265 family protein [Dyadobacter sp. CECT 9275]CAG4995186.1 hypothetical protein DYBT9275_01573 [Dyadobacter sp. CECT 9275]
MKHGSNRLALVGIGAAILISLGTSLPAFYGTKDFRKLDMLLGTWEMKTEKGSYFEKWNRNGRTAFSGVSFKVKGGDTTMLETVRLYLADRQIVCAPTTYGQNREQEVPFQLVTIEGQRFVFENPQHDFPQRIVYHFTGGDSLHAYIEGQVSQKMRRLDFYYSKQK